MRTLTLAIAMFLVTGCENANKAENKPQAKPEPAPVAAKKVEEKAPAPKPAAKVVNLHDAGPVGDATKGKEVYTRICTACHQPDGKGMGGMLAADFTKGDRLIKPDSVLLKSIAEGKQGKNLVMPPHKDSLNPQEMKDVLAYIRKTFTPKN